MISNISKKGVSEVVSYTLLIVIAVGISLLVYNYLSAYTPKDKSTCKTDISLIVSDAWCVAGSPGQVNVTLTNKGLFNIDAAYIRFGKSSRTVKETLNANDLYLSSSFVKTGGLKPGDSVSKSYSTSIAQSPGEYGLEIEPAVFDENDLAICPDAIIVQPVDCIDPSICTSFTCTSYGSCTGSSKPCLSATGSSPNGCISAPTQMQLDTLSSTNGCISATTCTLFTYSAWSPASCTTGQTQTRSVITSSPSGCTGGSPVTSQTCSSFTPIIKIYSTWLGGIVDTYTIPSGASSALIKVWGAGGGDSAGGAGGAGGFAQGNFTNLQAGDVIKSYIGILGNECTYSEILRSGTRIGLVIGGGGGASGWGVGPSCAGSGPGGNAGGEIGSDGTTSCDGFKGGGGTQTAGGAGGAGKNGGGPGQPGSSFAGGSGGTGEGSVPPTVGGQGGCGYFGGGGGGGGGNSDGGGVQSGGGGGGGSSYVTPSAINKLNIHGTGAGFVLNAGNNADIDYQSGHGDYRGKGLIVIRLG